MDDDELKHNLNPSRLSLDYKLRIGVDDDIKHEGNDKINDKVHGIFRIGGQSSFNNYNNYGCFGYNSHGQHHNGNMFPKLSLWRTLVGDKFVAYQLTGVIIDDDIAGNVWKHMANEGLVFGIERNGGMAFGKPHLIIKNVGLKDHDIGKPHQPLDWQHLPSQLESHIYGSLSTTHCSP